MDEVKMNDVSKVKEWINDYNSGEKRALMSVIDACSKIDLKLIAIGVKGKETYDERVANSIMYDLIIKTEHIEPEFTVFPQDDEYSIIQGIYRMYKSRRVMPLVEIIKLFVKTGFVEFTEFMDTSDEVKEIVAKYGDPITNKCFDYDEKNNKRKLTLLTFNEGEPTPMEIEY